MRWARLSVADRIILALRDEDLTAKELSMVLDVSDGGIRFGLYALRRKGAVIECQGGRRGPPGRPGKYVLISEPKKQRGLKIDQMQEYRVAKLALPPSDWAP